MLQAEHKYKIQLNFPWKKIPEILQSKTLVKQRKKSHVLQWLYNRFI